MSRVVFIRSDGFTRSYEAEDGESVMSVAVRNGVPEIAAECGGAGACGTCHCYIDDDWRKRLEPAGDLELDMLECVIEPTERSRLSCQIEVNEHLDGIEVHLPERQY